MNYNKEKVSDNEVKFIVTIDNKDFLNTENDVLNIMEEEYYLMM